MLSANRIESLQKKKDILSKHIESEAKSPSVDSTLLRHLKRQKLEIKEVIEGIRADDDPHAIH